MSWHTSKRSRASLLIACLATGTLLVISYALAAAYREVVQQTQQITSNLAMTVERDVGRDLHLVDASISGILQSLTLPFIENVGPQTRRAALFDQSMNQEEFGAFLVINREGWTIDISGSRELPAMNFTDREYFLHHRDDVSLDAFIGPVVTSRLDGQKAITVSRRIPTPDGSFQGVVVGDVHLAFFRHAFKQLDLGAHGSITLIQQDGTVLLREPDLKASFTISDATRSTYQEAARKQSGFGIAPGLDGVWRYYAFRRVSDLPMFVVVGLSVHEILTPWLHKLAVVGTLTLLLCGAATLLARALSQEFRRRQRAEQSLLLFNQELEARVLREVSAREDAQTRLLAGQRMEALGQLAGGVAHDLNNVLQAVSSANEILGRQTVVGPTHERLTGMIAEAADRGASVTRRLLVFARQSELKAELVDIAALSLGLKDLLVHTLGSGITIEVQAEVQDASAMVDRIQLETVLINLATNARDAMADRQGTLTIRVEKKDGPAAVQSAAVRGTMNFACISVSDTGCGMEPQVRMRAIEPFFTTKAVGKGTGLGLAMASGFAEQSGGRLTIDSALGVGTTVTLWLPHETAMLQYPSPWQALKEIGQPSPSARILLVDDDPIVRELLAEELAEVGYEVRQASHGAAALGMLDPAPDVLVTDLSMPGMDGLDLIRAARQRRPDLPAILVTGYAGDQTSLARAGAANGDYMLLHKPVRATQLVSQLAITLRTARTRAGQFVDAERCDDRPARASSAF